MGKEMDLNFQLFETATLFITVLVVAFMLQVRCRICFSKFEILRPIIEFTCANFRTARPIISKG